MAEVRRRGVQDGEEVGEAELPAVRADEVVGEGEGDEAGEDGGRGSVIVCAVDGGEEEGAPFVAQGELEVYEIGGVEEEEFDDGKGVAVGKDNGVWGLEVEFGDDGGVEEVDVVLREGVVAVHVGQVDVLEMSGEIRAQAKGVDERHDSRP